MDAALAEGRASAGEPLAEERAGGGAALAEVRAAAASFPTLAEVRAEGSKAML